MKSILKKILFFTSFVSSSCVQINWTKDTLNNPVLESSAPGAWDEPYLQACSVIYDGNEYHMWYSGLTNNGHGNIGYAWSTDGIAWQKYDDPATPNPPFVDSDPVLVGGQAES